MRVPLFVLLGSLILTSGCKVSVSTRTAGDQGGDQDEDKPRVTLEDVERIQGSGARYDRPVVTLGKQDAVAGGASGEEGSAGAARDGEGGEGEPSGEGAAAAEEPGSVGADDTGEYDETLGNDEGDEAI